MDSKQTANYDAEYTRRVVDGIHCIIPIDGTLIQRWTSLLHDAYQSSIIFTAITRLQVTVSRSTLVPSRYLLFFSKIRWGQRCSAKG